GVVWGLARSTGPLGERDEEPPPLELGIHEDVPARGEGASLEGHRAGRCGGGEEHHLRKAGEGRLTRVLPAPPVRGAARGTAELWSRLTLQEVRDVQVFLGVEDHGLRRGLEDLVLLLVVLEER